MIRRHRDRPQTVAHLDRSSMLLMLQGADVTGSSAAAEHLAACTVCRHQFERLDPLASLFAADVPAASPLPPHAPMPARRRRSPRFVVAVGVPLATAAAVALAFVTVPRSAPATPRDQLAQLTSQIRLAAARHDTVQLHQLLAQTSAVLRHLDTGGQNSSVHGELTDLRDVLQTLPNDPQAAAVTDQVDAAGGDEAANSPSPEATGTDSPAPTDDAAPPQASPTGEPPPDSTTPEPGADMVTQPTPGAPESPDTAP